MLMEKCCSRNNALYSNIKCSKPVLSGHSKIDKTKDLKTDGSVIKHILVTKYCITLEEN